MIGRLHYPDLRDTTMVSFWRECREIGFKEGVHFTYNKSEQTVTWWNGSETLFRNLDDPTGAKYGSLEVSTIFIDEGSEVPDDVYKVLFPSRLRWHLDGCTAQEEIERELAAGNEEAAFKITCACPRRAWICTNPGASGYLQDVVNGRMPTDDPTASWDWVPARPAENPFNGAEYIRDMEAKGKRYGPVWYKRFIEGSWLAFEGQRFPQFDRDRHVLKQMYVLDSRHSLLEGWDFGHRETFVTWVAFNPQGGEPIVVFDELQVNEVDEPSVVADAVKEIRARWGITNIVALGDPAGAAASQFSSVSPIAAYGALGLHIAPCRAGKSPIDRANLISEFLAGEHKMYDGVPWPGIVFGPNCTAVVNSIVNYRWKQSSSRVGEDPREQFLKKDDHGVDALGYALIGVPPPSLPPRAPARLAGVNVGLQAALEGQG